METEYHWCDNCQDEMCCSVEHEENLVVLVCTTCGQVAAEDLEEAGL